MPRRVARDQVGWEQVGGGARDLHPGPRPAVFSRARMGITEERTMRAAWLG